MSEPSQREPCQAEVTARPHEPDQELQQLCCKGTLILGASGFSVGENICTGV